MLGVSSTDVYYKASLDRLRRGPDGLCVYMTTVCSTRAIGRESKSGAAEGAIVHFLQGNQVEEWYVSIPMPRGSHVSENRAIRRQEDQDTRSWITRLAMALAFWISEVMHVMLAKFWR